MGNHRAERGPRRASSEDRASRKFLISRQSASSSRPSAAPQVVVPSPVPLSTVAETPVASAPTTGGKRAARPAPKSRTTSPAKSPRSARPVRSTRPVKPVRPSSPDPASATISRTPAVEALAAGGRRRADKHTGRGSLLKGLPSAPILAGVAALAISAGGAITATPSLTDADDTSTQLTSASALSTAADTGLLADRTAVVTRDSRRVAKSERSEAKLQAKAEAMTQQRTEALQTMTAKMEQRAAKIKADQWVMPVSGYRLTASFGMSSSLWSTSHTGLDFAAPSGTPLRAVANGIVTEVGYDGSYGNKTTLLLEDGTEIWYCHQTSTSVSVGDRVVGGQTIGTVGSTGNSTGPHLHLEVRPGSGGPVDPYSALRAHGLQP